MLILVFVLAIVYVMIGLVVFEIDSFFNLDGKDVSEELSVILLWPAVLAGGFCNDDKDDKKGE